MNVAAAKVAYPTEPILIPGNDGDEPDTEEKDPKRRLDPELAAVGAILRVLDKHPDKAKHRIMAYLSHRFMEQVPRT